MAFGFKNNSGENGSANSDANLSNLYAVLTDSQAKIAEYLLRCESQRSAPVAAGLDIPQFAAVLAPVLERLDSLGQMVSEMNERLLSPPFSLGDSEWNAEKLSESSASNTPPAPPAPPAHPEAPEPPEAPPIPVVPVSSGVDERDFARMVFGEGLVDETSTLRDRQFLLDGLLSGDVAARYFAGIWMMFQASPTEKKALLLKDLGEAFYRWAATLPNGYERFEGVFIPWVQTLCEQSGLQNTLERVLVGQRFDNSRHTSPSRGVEVVGVHGWVVLRNNGSVYAKALVDVQ